jgi:hypothetical protein
VETRTRGSEAEVDGAIRPSTVTGLTSPSANMWPRWGAGSAHCANTKRACASNWRCITSITTFVCPMPASASFCHSPCPPMAMARPKRGNRVHQPWPRGWPITSGRYARCSCFACRHGPSRRGSESTGMGGSSKGRGPEPATCIHNGQLQGWRQG